MKLTPKQANLFNKIIEPKPSEIYVQGSVQSGKTFVIALSIIEYTKELYKYDPDTKYNGAIVRLGFTNIKRKHSRTITKFLRTFRIYKRDRIRTKVW